MLDDTKKDLIWFFSLKEIMQMKYDVIHVSYMCMAINFDSISQC